MLEREVAKRMKYRQICYFRRLHRSLIYKYVHSWPAMQRGARGPDWQAWECSHAISGEFIVEHNII